MGPWFVEGLLRQLLSGNNAVTQLLSRARFYIVPTANPDGSFHGQLRTNAAGVDLNRAWGRGRDPASPEIGCISARLEEAGADFFFDVHGDETNPHCFIVNSDSVPGIDPNIIERRKIFEGALEQASPDFVKGHGYKQEAPGTADLSIGANWVTHRLGCLALTLEQPFKDPADQPVTEEGWSPARSMKLGADVLAAIEALMPR
jgi:murein tripeptide amidase MpaA